ncbi:MAG: hypothetical protein QM708_10180 [Propioniciclava sp.]|uniref:hypothetical protein n=1 Tax=Propioniciclava sp. TaxID=2038686 RepID=UPI0039E555D2
MTQQTHSAPRSRRRILLVTSLAVGTAASVALMVAAQWMTLLAWPALIVALLAGFLATWAALVEFREWRERAQADAARARAEERDRTQELHAAQRRVLGAVHGRVRSLSGELVVAKESLTRAESTLAEVNKAYGETRQQVSRLRGDNEALRIENDALRTVGEELWAENRQLRASGEAPEAEVVTLPRRRALARDGEWDLDSAPTVVDLDLARLAAPFISELRERHAN